MIIKGKWYSVEARTRGWCVIDENHEVIIGSEDEYGHYGPLTEHHAKEICTLHNTFRGYSIDKIEKNGTACIVGDELLKQDEIIQKLINLVEHYGNCYNHDLSAYHEYCVAKKYLEDKQ